MKPFTIHLKPLPRTFTGRPPVQSIGYIPEKRDVVNHEFSTYNFSFILSGSGFYKYEGKRIPVKGPCVVTQWPGAVMHYWPDPVWEELYLIYDQSAIPQLEERGFIAPRQPMWYLGSASLLRQKVEELARYLGRITEPRMVDRVDLLCESIILESRIQRASAPLSPEERVIREIEAHIRKDITAHYDFNLLARRHGLHPAKFRRYWNRFVGLPPARYLMQLCLAEAARLLVETAMPVGEVARAVGFVDELYFSKKFRKEYGLPATVYRRQHHRNLSLKDLPVTRG